MSLGQEVSEDYINKLQQLLNENIKVKGFEAKYFLVGWYNKKVQKHFKLCYDDNTVSFTIVSTPCMFEETFIPYLKNKESCDFHEDPLDTCIRMFFEEIKNSFLYDMKVQILYDFDVTPSRRPKILMQTAGHVSGIARFYQPQDLAEKDLWNNKKKIYGVSIHPKYGGWFAFRAVIILENILCSQLNFNEPEQIIKSYHDIIRLLQYFNDRNDQYRNIGNPVEVYSALQQKYFETLPSQRKNVIEEIKNS